MATRQRSAPRWARVALVVGLVLGLLVGVAAVSAQLLIDRWDGAVSEDDLLAPEARDPGADPGAGPDAGPGADPDAGPDADPDAGPAEEGTGEPATPGEVSGPLTYLVIGADRRPDDPSERALADAIVIVHIPAGLEEAYLISIPRDLRVPIPGHGTDKINAAYQLGGGGREGAQLLSRTLSEHSGVGFDGAAILDFRGFQTVVDALGGVEMCLDQPVRSIHTGEHFPAGCQELSGGQALDLARQRYDLPAGDFDRVVHHQQLIRAMVDRARSAGLLTNPLQLDRTIRAVGEAVTVDTGGVPLPELALALRHLRPKDMTGVTLPSYPQRIQGTSYVLAEPAADDLYQALRDSQLAEWLADNPRWRED